MPSQTNHEWVRTSMRTPGILIFGMVMCPCGWILTLTSTVSPNWRTIKSIPNQQVDLVVTQGIWDICLTFQTNSNVKCQQTDTVYFANQIISIAQGLMLASLIVTIIGLAVAIPGVRCWRNNPRWTLAGLAGILIFLSGVMAIIPIAWYTHVFNNISTSTAAGVYTIGYCIILGYIGGILEILGGFVMFIGICRCCGGKNRGETRVEQVMSPQRPKAAPRRIDMPSLSRSRSNAGSVPYSKDSLEDDVSFPRAKVPARPVNPSYGERPYDADL